MAEDRMRYDLLAQEALRGVVRAALRKVLKTGLPGEHHFYIAFDTCHPDVKISDRILARYPREMTVVLQHQFWNLQVREEDFEVELSFDNVPERLLVPFAAIKGFLDPSVQFGLQFESVGAPAGPIDRLPVAAMPSIVPAAADAEATTEEAPKVVSLDAFRKKN